MSEWISTKDKSPHDKQKVIIWDNENKACELVTCSKHMQGIDYYKPIGQGAIIYKHVTHWMPLPKPPKGE